MSNDSGNVDSNNVPLLGMNVKVNGGRQEVQFTDLATNVSGTPKAGEPITFTATTTGPQPVYYKFWYRAGYGTSQYGSNPWVLMQDFSTNNRCTYSFPDEGNCIVVVWGSNNPASVDPNTVPLIGMNVRTESTEPGYRWDFDEQRGSVANEFSGSGHNEAIHGATRVSGFCGGALHFNGTDDYVEVSDPIGLDLLRGITMSAWIKVDELFSSDYKTIASKDENGELHVNPEGKLYAWLKNDFGAVTDLTGSTMLSPGIWYQVAMTSETYGSLKVYVNGVEDGSRAFSGNLMTTSDPFQIGQDHGLLNRSFRGTIDTVYLYNRAIAPAEILQDMHCGTGTRMGMVTGAGAGNPVSGAIVTVTPGGYSATTETSSPFGTTAGRYEIKDIPVGVYTVVVAGYPASEQHNVVITGGETTLNFSLTPQ